MWKLGSISTTIGADIGPLNKAIGKAQTAVTGLADKVQSIGRGIDLNGAAKKMEAMAGQIAKANSSAARAAGKKAGEEVGDDLLKNLKAKLGEESAAGGLMKVLAGGGAIAAVGMMANQFNALTQSVEKLAMAARSGGDAWRQQTAELLVSIPVVGKLADGLARLQALADGTTAYVVDMRLATEATNLGTEVMAGTWKIISESAKQTAAYVSDVGDQIQAMAMTGLPLKLFEIGRQGPKDIQAILDKAEDAKNGGEIQGWLKRAQELRQQLAATPQMVAHPSWIQRKLPFFSSLVAGDPKQSANAAFYQTAAQLQVIQDKISNARKRIDADADAQVKAREQLQVAQTAESLVTAGAKALGEGLDWAGGKWSRFTEFLNKGTEQVKAAEASLAALRTEARQFGMTDLQKKLDNFRRMPGSSPQSAAEYERLAKQVEELTQGKKLEDLRREALGVGMSDTQRKLAELAADGMGGDQLAEAARLLKEIDLNKQARELADEARRAAEELQTPQERFQKTLEQLDRLSATELFRQSPDLLRRGVEDAVGKLQSSLSSITTGPAPLLMKGSQEAYQFRAQLQMERAGKKYEEEQFKELVKGNATWERIEKKMDFQVVSMNP